MKVVQIRKKSGKFRTVVIPEFSQKLELRQLSKKLQKTQERLCNPAIVHGFIRGKSPVTCAMAHIGHKYTISMDLTDFFDHVTADKVKQYVSKKIIDKMFIDPKDGKGSRACQGLPTSPVLANIAAISMDLAIVKAIDKDKRNIVYTRYADDLTFSFDDIENKNFIFSVIPNIVSRCQFKINKAKTRFMPASAGNRVICGIAVGEREIGISRQMKKKLRAVTFQDKIANGEIKKVSRVKRGLEEWKKLKIPTPIPTPEQLLQLDTVSEIVKKFSDATKLGPVKIPETYKNDTTMDGNFIITKDPAYILGMSAYTTGWKSCMAPVRQHFKGVKVWLYSSSKIGALLSNTTMNIGGIERRVMQARALLHYFRNGMKAYDRIYGDSDSTLKLKDWLELNGYIHVGMIPQGAQCIGNVPRLKNPYFDTLKAKSMIDNGKKISVIHR